ncbi:hypothetical protein Acy02nite_03630 [Actinoplanes cyaneus]|uniref:DUF3558 domain-containing protein n=1 Tax=Actinoplanes cyaneus TaxID=52696 RepID=A0A919M1J7_9ACTN|nr:hypothetical protein [Actinoplanes cyaneus]MCW2136148.1 hypothetical protein [Actinoplanes cyaneus]GID62482.1 hypothetical protein Acy02nite_03630 [Actinoplanes cyaneus]
MSGNGVAVAAGAVLLLAACTGPQPAPEVATTAPAPAGSCGVAASVPEGATLVPADVPAAGDRASVRYTLLTADSCGGGVAEQPDRCGTFPWATERNLYALGGRGWLSVAVGPAVREQIVFYAAQSSFADSFAQAAQDCGFSTLTVLDGDPVTLERGRDGRTEIVYLTARSVIWTAGTDPAVGVADLVRLAALAEERSALIRPPS